MPEEEEFPQETLDRLTFMRVHSIHGLMIGAFIYSSHPRPTVFTHPFQFSNKIEPKSRHRLGRIRGFFGKNTDDLKEPLQFSNVSQIKLAEMYWPSTKLEPFFSAILSEGKPFSRLRDLYLAYDRQLRAIPPPMVEQILPFFCAAPLEKIVTCEFFGLQLLDGLEQPQKLKSYKLLRPNDLLFKDTLQETVKWIASIFDRCPHLQLFQLPFEKHKQSITDSFLSVLENRQEDDGQPVQVRLNNLERCNFLKVESNFERVFRLFPKLEMAGTFAIRIRAGATNISGFSMAQLMVENGCDGFLDLARRQLEGPPLAMNSECVHIGESRQGEIEWFVSNSIENSLLQMVHLEEEEREKILQWEEPVLRMAWWVAVLFVTPQTHQVSLYGDRKSVFVPVLLDALRWKEKRGLDGFWMRDRKLNIGAFEPNTDVGKSLQDWVAGLVMLVEIFSFEHYLQVEDEYVQMCEVLEDQMNRTK